MNDNYNKGKSTDTLPTDRQLVDWREQAMSFEIEVNQAINSIKNGIVMAAGGYPGAYRKGDAINGLLETDLSSNKVFHAGTASREDQIVTNSGRVLCVTALGDDIQQAQQHAYVIAQQIRWEDVYYRSDIGYRAVARAST